MKVNLKIRGKLLIILTVFAIVPASIITLQSFNAMENVRETSLHQIQIVSEGINDLIDRNLFERYGDVQAFTYNSAVYDTANWNNPSDKNPLTNAMDLYMKNYGLYKLMMLVGNDGKLLAVNTKTNLAEPIDTAPLYQHNYSKEKWFIDASTGKFLEGTNGLTGSAVQQPEASSIVADIYKTDGYTIAFSAPAIDASGKAIGVWVNFADFGLVDDIVATQYATISKALWKNLEITILDPNGTVVVDFDSQNLKEGKYARDLNVVGKLNLVEKKLPAAVAVIKGESGNGIIPHVRKNIDQAGGYSRSKGAYDYTGMGWSTIVRVPTELAFAGANQMVNALLLGLAVTLSGAIVLATIIGSKAAKPVRTLAGIVESLAGGNNSVVVPMTGRYDELGDIARATQIFKDNALKLDKMTENQEAHKKQSDIDKKAGQEKIATEFESSIKGIVSTVANSANQLSNTAKDMAGSIVKSSKLALDATDAATKTTNNVQTVAAASEELSSSVREISSQLQKTSQLVALSRQKAENADGLANALTIASDKVSGAMEMISSIAGQINLLALNATIESARAGEAGKGFAVVASEVKNLAGQTDKSVTEIQGVIIEMRNASNAIIAALNDIKSSVESITEATSSVASAVEEQSATTNEITKNMQIAATGTQTISDNLGNVSASSSQAGVAADQMLKSSQELSQQAEGLSKQVDTFLVKIRAA